MYWESRVGSMGTVCQCGVGYSSDRKAEEFAHMFCLKTSLLDPKL